MKKLVFLAVLVAVGYFAYQYFLIPWLDDFAPADSTTDENLPPIPDVCRVKGAIVEDAIYDRGVHLSKPEWVAGILLIFGAIEFTRRTTGLIIPVLIILALTYVGWWGQYVGGVFKFSGLTAETILFRSVYGDDGLFGNIARISATGSTLRM